MGKTRTIARKGPSKAQKKKRRRASAGPKAGSAAAQVLALGLPGGTRAVEVQGPPETDNGWKETAPFFRRGPDPALAAAPIAVRATTPADASAVAALWMELHRQTEVLGPEWITAEGAAERYAKSMSAACGNPRSIHLVAEMETGGSWRIVGFLHATVKLRSSVFRDSVVGEIQAVHVAGEAAGRGVGSSLVAAAMDWFRKRDITRVEAQAPAANLPARGFLQAMGFRDSARLLWADLAPREGEKLPAVSSEAVRSP